MSSVLESKEQFMAAAAQSTEGNFEQFYFTQISPASASGVAVNHESALRHAMVFACINAISETVGSLPL